MNNGRKQILSEGMDALRYEERSVLGMLQAGEYNLRSAGNNPRLRMEARKHFAHAELNARQWVEISVGEIMEESKVDFLQVKQWHARMALHAARAKEVLHANSF